MARKKVVAKAGAVVKAGAGKRGVLATVRAGSGAPGLVEVQVDPQAAEAFISAIAESSRTTGGAGVEETL